MLKLVITASALALCMPALAQEAGTDTQTDPATQETAPDGDLTTPPEDLADDATMDETLTDETTTDQTTAAQTTPSKPIDKSESDDPEAATPPSTMDDDEATTEDPGTNDPGAVDQFVEQQFPSYDGDSSGELNKDEFAAWLAPLHHAEIPDADEAAVADWTGKAFAQADTDKNAGVSKDELKVLLAG